MAADDRTVLVTGAGGFAGRHLIAELERHTVWTVIGLGRHAEQGTERTRMLVCDLQDRKLVERTIAHYRPDAIVHLAAQSYVPQSIASPSDTVVNNTVGQINVLEGCLAADILPVVLVVGSSDEYGFARPEEMPVTEDQPFRPGNPYAVSKITQDMLGYQYFRTYGLPIVCLRPFNHFGPGQSDRFVLSSFARQIAEAEAGVIEPTVLTGDLTSKRDFCDVRDVARAYRLAVDRCEPGEAYNIASGTAHSMKSLLDMLLGMATISIGTRQDSARLRPSDVPVMVGSADKFMDATGWRPEIPMERSLMDTLNYWRHQIQSRSS